ncbi:uncharacterized protein LOC143146155 [Ptiloglossa arizonensis]|uniref:uncharacterized protein LOC143146155 n=1 Tax=Ptiloglossa arizonensis TaxID=3350558 RepID=UPI003F9F061F
MSCFTQNDERIYMVEMLIHKLTLTRDKIKDIDEYPIVVKVRFMNFPVFEITRQDFYSYTPPPPEDDGCTLRFMIGRSCMFIMRPKDLVQELQSTMTKVGVFRLGDNYPIAETEITLPGCLCDQVAMAQNDANNLPKPFVVKDSYNLLDPGDNPSGSLEMELRLVCFGKSVMTEYEMQPKYFAFKNQDQEREYCVRRLVPAEYLPEGADPNDISRFPDRTTTAELKGIVPQPSGKKEKKGKRKDKRKGKGGKRKGEK